MSRGLTCQPSPGTRGFGGEDTFNTGDASYDIDGGPGSDTVSFARAFGRNGSVVVDLRIGVAHAAEDDPLASIENVVGSDGDDVITGNDSDNVLRGGPGVDVITGEGGNDKLYGGYGNDVLDAGDGDDLIDGADPTEPRSRRRHDRGRSGHRHRRRRRRDGQLRRRALGGLRAVTGG